MPALASEAGAIATSDKTRQIYGVHDNGTFTATIPTARLLAGSSG
jgi:hypothetical protein